MKELFVGFDSFGAHLGDGVKTAGTSWGEMFPCGVGAGEQELSRGGLCCPHTPCPSHQCHSSQQSVLSQPQAEQTQEFLESLGTVGEDLTSSSG